ncbi:MAG: hypothetical protein ABI378_14060, partial [Chitinophagaceae bacterium]
AHPANSPAITQKEISPLDLRPAAIAKLQQMVEAGSDSLYQLGIDSLHTDIVSGTIILKGVSIQPDSNIITKMRREKSLPDDIYHISLASLRITGIGLADFLHGRNISLGSIICAEPQITVNHQLQAYNSDKRAKAKRSSLFSRLRGQIDKLAIDSISITQGNFKDQSSGITNTYHDVSIALKDILIDSVAEKDTSRFLFAKVALLQTGKIIMPTGKSQYDLSIGGIAISGEKRQVVIRDLALKPHGGKEAFLSHQKTQVEVYDIAIPSITLNGVDWWAAAHGESLIAKDAELTGSQWYIYVDQRLPSGITIKRDNFPQQMLEHLRMPVSVHQVMVQAATLTYEEFTRKSGKQSRITFNNMDAIAEGFSNLPSEIAIHPVAHFSGTCRFMNATDMAADFALSLPRKKLGAFKGNLSVGGLTSAMINPFGEGMGLIRITSGQVQYAKVHVEGNNNNVHGTVAAAYTDLHILPLKPSENRNEKLKKRPIIGKIANLILIKSNNPAKGATLRRPSFTLDRINEANFFNFVWMGAKQGLLKTIGVPTALGM